MNRDEELEHLRQENRTLRQTLAAKDAKLLWLKQEKRLLLEALQETIQAIAQLRIGDILFLTVLTLWIGTLLHNQSYAPLATRGNGRQR